MVVTYKKIVPLFGIIRLSEYILNSTLTDREGN
jgi:hypothetical protein